jgi:dihydropteroate synthase
MVRDREEARQNASPDASLASSRAEIWGVLNVTPDSFSDGGRFLDVDRACAHAKQMLAEGASVVDVGGESSRPAGKTYGAGAERISADEELARVLPVVLHLVKELGARVSVDTVKGAVARRCLDAGAAIVNDVSGGSDDALLDAVAGAGAELVLMHNRGRGEVTPENTRYDDVVAEVRSELLERVDRAVSRGVAREKIWLDPGVGFAKTPEQSLALVARTAELVTTGHRVLVGTSRKSFLAELAPLPGRTRAEKPMADERVGGTCITSAWAVLRGAHAVRVHDVLAVHQAVRLAEAMRAAEAEAG